MSQVDRNVDHPSSVVLGSSRSTVVILLLKRDSLISDLLRVGSGDHLVSNELVWAVIRTSDETPESDTGKE